MKELNAQECNFLGGTDNHNRITCVLFHKILQYTVVLNISGHQSGKSNFKQMQRMSQHNNAPLKLRNLHHLSWGNEIVRRCTFAAGEWDCEKVDCSPPEMLSWRRFEEAAFRGLFALCFSTLLKHCWRFEGLRCYRLFVWWLLSMIAGIWQSQYTRIQPNNQALIYQVPRYSVGSGTLRQGTQRGQIVCLVAFGGGRACMIASRVTPASHDSISQP